jgi:type I restriction enzyme S subunit
MARLGDYVRIRTGKLDANASSENGQYPFFTCAVVPLKIDTYSYDCECLLISGNIDFNLTYYNGRFDAYQRIYIIESRDASQWQIPYLHACLRQYLPSLKHQSVGGVIKYIRRPMLTDLCVPIPDTATQQRIGKVTLQLQSMEQELRSAVSQHEKLFSSLLHRFFARFTAVS